MRVTKTNVLLGVTPSIFTGASSDSPANITDPDFSTSYTSSDTLRLTFDFGVTSEIDYVAVAGINIADNIENGQARGRVYDGSTIITTTFVIRNHCILMTFTPRSFSNLRIVIRGQDVNPQIHFCAAGESFEVPNGGEVAGYNRQFLRRNTKNRATLNSSSAPVAVLKKKVAPKGALNLPNMTKAFTEGEWQDFLDFISSGNYFFIREQDPASDEQTENTNNSAYLCFDPEKMEVKAHPQTRALNNITLSFKVFNGL